MSKLLVRRQRPRVRSDRKAEEAQREQPQSAGLPTRRRRREGLQRDRHRSAEAASPLIDLTSALLVAREVGTNDTTCIAKKLQEDLSGNQEGSCAALACTCAARN